MQRVLVAREYAVRGKTERGAIRAYLSKISGLSVPQITRLIRLNSGEEFQETLEAAETEA